MFRRVVATSLLLACSGCFDPKAAGGLDGSAGSDADTADAGPLPSGETCDLAIPLGGAGVTSGSTVGRVDDYEGTGTRCPGTLQAEADVVYTIDVPPSSRLLATVDPEGNYDSTIMIVDASGCQGAPSMCLGSDDTGDPGSPDVASWVNPEPTPASVFIIVDGFDAADGEGPFALRTSFDGAATGETCATPIGPLGIGQLQDQTTSGFRGDFDTSPCVPSAGVAGGDRVYLVVVPDAETWEVAVAPGHAFDPTLVVFTASGDGTSCGAACVGQSDTLGEGLGEVVTLPGGGTYWVVVDGVASGAFTLTIRVAD